MANKLFCGYSINLFHLFYVYIDYAYYLTLYRIYITQKALSTKLLLVNGFCACLRGEKSLEYRMGCSYSRIPKSVERDFLFFNKFRKHSIVKMLDCILNSGCFKLRWYGKLGYNGLRNLNIAFLRWQTVSAMVVRKRA